MGDAAQARRARDRDRRAVSRALRSARARRRSDREPARGGDRRPRSRRRWQTVDSLDEDRILRRFVNAVQSAIRTNFYQPDKDGAAEAADRDQVRQPQARRRAAAAAALRNLRLFAARRRRAPALRQGRARRHPLVRPAAGLPHRDPRPGQGAAGQERRHRAGRRQGRLRAEADADGRRRARRSRPRASPPTSCSSRRCSTSPTISAPTARRAARRTWCATTATIPISSSPPTRAPRPSPTSPTRISEEHGFWLGDAFASGGSAGYDHKKMGITARGAWESVKRHFREMDVDIRTTPFTVGRRRRHVGRRVRQRHAARADDEARSPRSTTATSSSIPTPIRRRASPSASGCSSCRARAGRITTRR